MQQDKPLPAYLQCSQESTLTDHLLSFAVKVNFKAPVVASPKASQEVGEVIVM